MNPHAGEQAGPRYLLVRLGALGDVIHAIPVAAALRAYAPRARVDWLVDPRYADIVRMVRGVDHAITVNPRGSKRQLLTTLRDLRRTSYDVAFDVQGLIKSAALARLSGARTVLGFPRAHLREPQARAFYTATPDVGNATTHVVRKGLALVAAVGAPVGTPEFPLDVPASAAAGQVVGEHPSGFALLNPGAAWPNKQWPAARFGALAAHLRRQHGLASVVTWGPGEESIATQVVEASDGAASLAPATGIVDLFGLSKAARVVVSGDTGPLHIACAVGAPAVALFGPTVAARNGPWDWRDVVVARTEQCECLYRRQCQRATRCIDDIEVDEVTVAVDARLRAAGV